MRLLIAGGAGYVGSTLIPKLLDRGYKVDVVDLFWFGNHLPRQTGILNKDIFHLTIEDLEPYDQVIFLAGLSNDPMAEYSPNKNFIFNAAAPSYLAYIAMKDRTIVINSPSIWRPILGIQDAATAYIRAIEANHKISGIFNVASGNYTVGEVGDLVKATIEEKLPLRVKLCIKHIQDFRNYKVSIEKAKNVLSFHPAADVRSIVGNLIDNMDKYHDWESPLYSNIEAFKAIDHGIEIPAMASVA